MFRDARISHGWFICSLALVGCIPLAVPPTDDAEVSPNTDAIVAEGDKQSSLDMNLSTLQMFVGQRTSALLYRSVALRKLPVQPSLCKTPFVVHRTR